MRTPYAPFRVALALLLVISAGLFAAGSTIERNERHQERRAPAAEEAGGESGEESGESHAEESEAGSQAEPGAVILGVDTESVGVMVAAIVASLLLAAAVWFRSSKVVLFAVAAFGVVFAAGDVRELVHQLDESRGDIAAIAAVLIALHLVIAALAGVLSVRLRGSRSEPQPSGQ